jgi:arsenite methyltransferase
MESGESAFGRSQSHLESLRLGNAEWSKDQVRRYYGEQLQSNKDLKTTVCCSADALPEYIKPIAAQIHTEVLEKFYGCGTPLPMALEGMTVVDLGCGSGRDAFILSKLVGPHGRVIGVDMTAEQLAVATKHQQYHADAFGYQRSNVTFKQGFIEALDELDIRPNSVDLVVSNCVFNLSPDKPRLFRGILEILKPGGELYFSDVFADRRLPNDLRQDPVLLGECLGGAMYTEDFRRLLMDLGIRDLRTVSQAPIAVTAPGISARVGHIRFASVTVRAFKLPLEDRCEDFGQAVEYLGTIPEAPTSLVLDDHHLFEKHRLVAVCGNTRDMILRSRFGPHFRLHGCGETHYGVFRCGPGGEVASSVAPSCC